MTDQERAGGIVMGKFERLTFRVVTNPLTDAMAYWHACTGKPYEEQTKEVPIRYDQYAPRVGLPAR